MEFSLRDIERLIFVYLVNISVKRILSNDRYTYLSCVYGFFCHIIRLVGRLRG